MTPFDHDKGSLTIPTGPGLGFEIDPHALSWFGRKFYTATPMRVAVRAVWDRGLKAARALGETRSTRLAARSKLLEGKDPVKMALEAL